MTTGQLTSSFQQVTEIDHPQTAAPSAEAIKAVWRLREVLRWQWGGNKFENERKAEWAGCDQHYESEIDKDVTEGIWEENELHS